MKNLKLFVAGVLVTLAGGLSVSAATLDELVEAGKLELVDGVYKLKSDTATVDADIELASGTAVLDLNGKTLTNEGRSNY